MSHACHMLHAHYFTGTKHQRKVQTVLRAPQQIHDLYWSVYDDSNDLLYSYQGEGHSTKVPPRAA